MRKKVKLDGSEVASFIKDRQRHAVRALKQSAHVQPRLAIVRSAGNPAVDIYLRLKRSYADEIGVEIVIHEADKKNVDKILNLLSKDDSVQGIILQLPFENLDDLDRTFDNIAPEKDVDNLRGDSIYDAPTSVAVLWLLAAYNIDLPGKNIVVIGQGRLVGLPLTKMLFASGIEPIVIDEATKNRENIIAEADIIITGVGKPGIIKSSTIKAGAMVIDAGIASDNGVMKGDVEDAAREREDISITPRVGGVGPLTVAALFENLIRASQK